jgi:hypothetical protein
MDTNIFISYLYPCFAIKSVEIKKKSVMMNIINHVMSSEYLTSEKPYKSCIRIDFKSTENAMNVKSCLEIDDELQPDKILKSLEVDGTKLIV